MAVQSDRRVTEVDPASARLQDASARKRVRWAVETFGDQLVMSSSFGAQSAVMLHMVSSMAPHVPIILVDTGYLFPETYRFIEALKGRLQLNLHVYRPRMTAARQEALFGKLWEGGGRRHLQVQLDEQGRTHEPGPGGFPGQGLVGRIAQRAEFQPQTPRRGYEAGQDHQGSPHHRLVGLRHIPLPDQQ